MALTRIGPNQSINLASNVTGTLLTRLMVHRDRTAANSWETFCKLLMQGTFSSNYNTQCYWFVYQMLELSLQQ